MKRSFVILLIMFVWLGCGQKEQEKAATDQQEVASEQARDEPRQMLQGESEEFEMRGAIKPYFDENGTVTELMVSPGEQFDVYVIAQYGADEHMTAAEYKLSLPEGVSIHRSVETDSATLQSGDPDVDFMIAFRCTPGPQIVLATYTCTVGEAFSGGEIGTAEGDRSQFIGLVECGDYPDQFRSEKGAVILKKKP